VATQTRAEEPPLRGHRRRSARAAVQPVAPACLLRRYFAGHVLLGFLNPSDDPIAVRWQPACICSQMSGEPTMPHKKLSFRSEAEEKILRGRSPMPSA
jgi:hypothetical protein